MATREEKAAKRAEMLDRLSRTPLDDRPGAILELSAEYGYSPAYIYALCVRHSIELPRRKRKAEDEGTRGPSPASVSAAAVEEAFEIVAAYLVRNASYKSVAEKLGVGPQRVQRIVRLAKEKGVIG